MSIFLLFLFADVAGPQTPPPGLETRLNAHCVSVEEGRKALSARDEFIAALSPFDRAARLKSEQDVGEKEFLAFVADQVRPWTEAETARVEACFAAIEKKTKGFQLGLPDPVLVVKTTGAEEGDAAYTRGDAVVLPQSKADLEPKELEKLLAHELFHVLSRRRPELRKRLYPLVGFEPCDPVELPAELRPRKITNPDAPRFDARIELDVEGKRLQAVPVLFSSQARYDAKAGGEFFRYLMFRLLVIEPQGYGRQGWAAKLRDGKPWLLEPEKTPDYRAKAGRNTGYIIHPEEILADNFVLLLEGRKDVPSPEILEGMAKVLSRAAPAAK